MEVLLFGKGQKTLKVEVFDNFEKTRLYAFITLDRLTEADYRVGLLTEDEAFGMDDLGNRTTVNLRSGVDQVYTTDPLTNRYTAIDSPSQTLFYDAAGNLTQDRDGYRYVYDYENRITRIYKLSGQTEITVAQYAYDALGRRIWKYDPTAAATNVYYYYNDQWQILAEYTADTTCRQWFTYGNYIDEVLSRSTHPMLIPVMQYYTHDHLYSPAALANYFGNAVLERYEYDAYGRVQVLSSEFSVLSSSQYANPFTFTGRQLDILDSGALHHMHYRHRDYSPTLGRFMQHDPFGTFAFMLFPVAQYLDGLNIYQYAESNSIIRVDPWGLYYPIPGYNPGKGQSTDGPFGDVCGSGAGATWIPDDTSLIGGADYSSACQAHDSCYGGTGRGGCDATKKDCDNQFLSDMINSCIKKYQGEQEKMPKCFSIANIYRNAVDRWGQSAFDSGREQPPCNQERPCPQAGTTNSPYPQIPYFPVPTVEEAWGKIGLLR